MRHPSLFKIALFILLIALPLTRTAAQAEPPAPVELRVMTFNIWVGGEVVDFGKVIEAIRTAKADVVGLQEISGNIHRIATALGWQHVNERMGVISRFPIIDLNGAAVFVQVKLGQVVAIANTHLPSDPYGPYLVRDGEPLEAVLKNEQDTRMGDLNTLLGELKPLIDAKFPLFLTGDFNSPSHLDWTEAGAAVRRQKAYPVEWPVSKALIDAGFKDTYRTAHPDPVAKQGNTWTYGNPIPRLRPDETIDRIDFVYASGDVEVTDSQVVGEAGGPDVDIPIEPFPSDHRSVVSTVKVRPVEPPLFVAFEQRRIVAGQPFIVRYHAPQGELKDRIAIVAAGGNAVKAALLTLPPYEADFFGAVTFGSATLKPGKYDAVLIGEGDKELARSTAWVVAPNVPYTVTTSKTTYRRSEPIVISWPDSPGNRADWIGIYKDDETNLFNYLAYLYTGAAVSGSVTFEPSEFGDAPLPAGKYRAVLALDDGYIALASVNFTVAK